VGGEFVSETRLFRTPNVREFRPRRNDTQTAPAAPINLSMKVVDGKESLVAVVSLGIKANQVMRDDRQSRHAKNNRGFECGFHSLLGVAWIGLHYIYGDGLKGSSFNPLCDVRPPDGANIFRAPCGDQLRGKQVKMAETVVGGEIDWRALGL